MFVACLNFNIGGQTLLPVRPGALLPSDAQNLSQQSDPDNVTPDDSKRSRFEAMVPKILYIHA